MKLTCEFTELMSDELCGCCPLNTDNFKVSEGFQFLLDCNCFLEKPAIFGRHATRDFRLPTELRWPGRNCGRALAPVVVLRGLGRRRSAVGLWLRRRALLVPSGLTRILTDCGSRSSPSGSIYPRTPLSQHSYGFAHLAI